MPLSEHEQRILSEIEANLKASDPDLAQQVSETTVYRHSARIIKWSAAGFFAGLVLLLSTFTRSVALGVVGFLVMLGCLLVVERHVRKIGKAGFESLIGSFRSGRIERMWGSSRERFRERWRRDDG